MSRSKLLAILGTSAFVLGSFAMGGCPGGSSGDAVADESTDSTASDTQDTSQFDEPVVIPENNPADNPPDITDAGNNDSGLVGDFDGDGVLTEADISILAKSFDSNLPGGDLNSDNAVNIYDLALLLSLVR